MTTPAPAPTRVHPSALAVVIGIIVAMLIGGALLWGYATSRTMTQFSTHSLDNDEIVGSAFLHLLATLLLGVGLGLLAKNRFISILVAVALVVVTFMLWNDPSVLGSNFFSRGFFAPVGQAAASAAMFGATIPLAIVLIGPRHRVLGLGFLSFFGTLLTVALVGYLFIMRGPKLFWPVGDPHDAGAIPLALIVGALAGVAMWSVIFGNWSWLVVLVVAVGIGLLTAMSHADILQFKQSLPFDPTAVFIAAPYGVWTLVSATLIAAIVRRMPPRTRLDVPEPPVEVPLLNAAPLRYPKAQRGFAQPGEVTPL